MFKWSRKVKLLLILSLIILFLHIYVNNSYINPNELFEKTFLHEPDVSKWYNYTEDQLNGPSIQMDDPRLVQKLYAKFLIPPPFPPKPYRLEKSDVPDPSMGQSDKIRGILKDKKNGVFLEVGALDGETRSNTLYFERFLNWTGLLIEPDPLNFAQLLTKNRRAWVSPTCLSVKPYPEIALFEQNSNMGKLAWLDSEKKSERNVIKVQCFPLYTYLLALNMTHIDYLSIDVEGAELEVLKNLPFQRLSIQTLSVEFAHVPGGKDAIAEYMLSQDYVIDSEVTNPLWLANDFIFRKI